MPDVDVTFDAGGAVGGAIGGVLGQQGQSSANKHNRVQAHLNREFQEYMSNTAHRREMRDLRRGGLNPILTALGGSGASTPSGATAHMESTTAPAITAALDGMRLRADIKKINADVKNIDQNTQTSKSQAKLIEAQIPGARGKSQVDAGLGKTVQTLMPYIDQVQKLTQQNQNAPKKQGGNHFPMPIQQLKTKD